jgi:hypothetical protein
MKALLAVCLIVTGLGPPASAEPLHGKQVSVGARWLVHIDADAIRAGSVPRRIGGLWRSLPSASEGLDRLTKAIGMDPTKDLHSVTVYGQRYAQPDAVVIVRAEVDRGRLMALLRTRPGFRTESYGKHELVLWTEKQGKKNEHTVAGCFYQPTLVVFGRDAAAVKKALDVLDGTSPSLAESDPFLAPAAPEGTMIQVRATGLADVQPLKSPLVQQSKSLFVALGENRGEAFAAVRLLTDSADAARRIRAVVEGFLAMAALQFESDQEALKILDAVKVSADDKTVTVECRGPTEDVAKLVEKLWAKQLKPKQAD